MRAGRIAPGLERELAAVAAAHGCELLQLEFKGSVLRLFLDRPDGGVTLGDCEGVSKEASALLDLFDFGDRRYTLEVSSPGLDRQLYGPRDFERFTGRLVKVTYRAAETGSQRTLVGRLAAFRAAGGGEIEVVEKERGEVAIIAVEQIKVARLQIEP
jgi:ribosome maturation factor RimP